MCSNRNVFGDVSHAMFILDHWEMCSNRNKPFGMSFSSPILDHWEMCSNRNLVSQRDRPSQF